MTIKEQSNTELIMAEAMLKPRVRLPFGLSLDFCDMVNIAMKSDFRPLFRKWRYDSLVSEANCGGYIP